MDDRTEPSAEELGARLFRALGSPIRLQMLRAIAQEDRCVHALVDLTGASQPLVSQHLRVLRQANLLQARKVGREMHYRLADQHIAHIVADAMAHAAEHRPPN
ncbi:metalloregulator ArsR/SmtB family transcription factor [Luteococcus peritonei]|uniref:ArsR/SmtB family transcription factor n=1 Tax=Luteococcus peritonei TaxID=88874 RepID=A0ABW4RT23_9ACTN